MSDTPSSLTAHSLYQDHRSWLHAWLTRRVRSRWDAADLMQDTFARALAGSDIRTIRQPRAFLTTIAHGLMVNHLRRRDIERAYLEELARLPPDVAPNPEQQALILESLMAIDRMLDGLPSRVRECFLLAQLDGWSYAEIADHLRVSTSSVKQYLCKAVAHCLRAPG